MIVTLLEVARSLPGKHGLYGYNVELTHMGSKLSLLMEPSPLPVLTDSSSEGLAPDAPLHSAAEGTGELVRIYSTDSLEQFLAS